MIAISYPLRVYDDTGDRKRSGCESDAQRLLVLLCHLSSEGDRERKRNGYMMGGVGGEGGERSRLDHSLSVRLVLIVIEPWRLLFGLFLLFGSRSSLVGGYSKSIAR